MTSNRSSNHRGSAAYVITCLVSLFIVSITPSITITITATFIQATLSEPTEDTRQDTALYQKVKHIREAIEARNQPCYHNKDIRSARDYVNNVWKAENPDDEPVIVFPFCLENASLGNWLGNYFNEVSCALLSGGHFVTTRRPYRHPGHPDIPVNMLGNHVAFYDAFPEVVVNAHNGSHTDVRSAIQAICKCPSYCWSSSDAPWTKNVGWIKGYIHKAVEAYLETAKGNFTNGKLVTRLTNDTGDLSTLPLSTELPFVPDVVIHYRCGDNMIYGKFGYGILPFYAYLPFIPADAKYIYILSDHPRRFGEQGFTHWCNNIIEELFTYLHKALPDKVIVVKKGGDQFLDFARIAYANVTVCSVSTFCLYPALGSSGQVYFPVNKLLPHHNHSVVLPPVTAGAVTAVAGLKNKDIELWGGLAPQFKWFSEPAVVSNIKDYHPWHLVKYTLKGIPPGSIPKEDMEGQLIKGSSRSVFLVKNGTRHAFGGMEVFEGLGFKWEDIWAVTDKEIELFKQGEDLQMPPGKDKAAQRTRRQHRSFR